jgi:hypothetical protein
MTDDYTIVEADKVEELIDMVNGLIAQGWQPTGGVTTASTPLPKQIKYYQAMTYASVNSEVKDS